MTDTVAEIISSGLLGDKYLSLVPGGADKDIPPGGKIKYTQSSVSLENLIGQMIFSPGSGKKEEGGAPPALLSTHPSNEARIKDLEVFSQRVLPLYEQARAAK